MLSQFGETIRNANIFVCSQKIWARQVYALTFWITYLWYNPSRASGITGCKLCTPLHMLSEHLASPYQTNINLKKRIGGLALKDMKASSHGNAFRITCPYLCVRNPEGIVGRPVTQSFDVFFVVNLNKLLNKQSRGWWFETPWHHCNGHITPAHHKQ